MSTTAKAIPNRLPRTFDGHVRLMAPHAIRDDVDYDNVAELMNRLALLARPTPGQGHYLDTLEALVDAYDREHADPALAERAGTPVERLRYLVESAGIGVGGLGKVIGSVSAASMAFSGKRELSKDHIRKLSAHFGISADYFL